MYLQSLLTSATNISVSGGLLGQQGSILRAKYIVTQSGQHKFYEYTTQDGARREKLDLNLIIQGGYNPKLVFNSPNQVGRLWDLKTCQNAF